MRRRFSIPHLLAAALGLALVVFWAGCSSGDTGADPRADLGPPVTATSTADITIVARGAPRLTQVQPVPGHIVLAPGETVKLNALAFDQNGSEVRQANISWQTLDLQAGTITSSGVFRAGFREDTFDNILIVTARPPTGSALGSAVQATVSVTVREFGGQLQPVAIRLFPSTVELEPEESLSLTALALDANGVAIPGMNFKWEMLEPQAGSISRFSLLTASTNVGTFSRAIRVSLVPGTQTTQEPISAVLDVRVVDPTSVSLRYLATVQPQVRSLQPTEEIRFSALILDRQGNPIPPVDLRWEVVDPQAGVISKDGRFTAGIEPGVYTDAVRATMGVPGAEERLIAKGTVAVLDLSSALNQGADPSLTSVGIFPQRISLAPGESARVTVIGLNGDLRSLSTTNVNWSLSPPEVAEVSRFVTVTAHDFPGIYEDAIRATVTVDTPDGLVTKEVTATLIIRDKLERVEITPKVVTLAKGERFQFRAVAYDKNGVLLPDISFRWRASGRDAGSIETNGLFVADGDPGDYPEAILVEAREYQ